MYHDKMKLHVFMLRFPDVSDVLGSYIFEVFGEHFACVSVCLGWRVFVVSSIDPSRNKHSKTRMFPRKQIRRKYYMVCIIRYMLYMASCILCVACCVLDVLHPI